MIMREWEETDQQKAVSATWPDMIIYVYTIFDRAIERPDKPKHDMTVLINMVLVSLISCKTCSAVIYLNINVSNYALAVPALTATIQTPRDTNKFKIKKKEEEEGSGSYRIQSTHRNILCLFRII